jgi:hypothetical protein
MVAALLSSAWPAAVARAESFGSFKGEVVARFLPDGREIELMQPFVYIDSKGRRWEAPAGSRTDGASIPQAFWVTYPPFTGHYRTAAVIHDHLTRTQATHWRDAHEIFYSAMRAAGVGEATAKSMYWAVYNFAQRWGVEGQRAPGAGLSREQQEKALAEAKAWIERENPSLEEIAKRGLVVGAKP